MSASHTIRLYLSKFVALTPQIIQNTFYKARSDRQFLAQFQHLEDVSPGYFEGFQPIHNGINLRFQDAELEIVYLLPDIVRLSWTPGNPPPTTISQKAAWPDLTLSIEEMDDSIVIASGILSIRVNSSGRVSFYDHKNTWLRGDLIPEYERWESTQSYHPAYKWKHRTIRAEKEVILGLGERAVSYNRNGEIVSMWNTDPRGSYRPGVDPLYLCIPTYLAIKTTGSYLVFYENTHPGEFNFEGIHEQMMSTNQVSFEDGMLRYYFIPGPPARAISRYIELTGRPQLPPRWALGYHQSQWGYRTEEDIRKVASGFLENDMPVSAIHLDLDYMDGYRIFTINKKRFPDLPKLSQDLLDKSIHLVTIIDAGVKAEPGYCVYDELIENGFYCTGPDSEPATGVVWPGKTVFPDFTNPAARAWWGNQYQGLIAEGISGIWHDMNEPSSFTMNHNMTLPLNTGHNLEGRGGFHQSAHNLYGQLMNQAAFEALRKFSPDKRPWILSRSGWAGVAQYAWSWTGDMDSSWENLRLTLKMVLGLSLSGVPYSGADIGGFNGNPSPELYLRWFQMSTFLPLFRTHTAVLLPPREPWRFKEPHKSILREFLKLRYRLLPYLYTLAWQATRNGHPLVRPLFWPDASDPDLWEVEDAFFLGDALLVAPILERGASGRQVSLPEGQWYHYWHDTLYIGPVEVRLEGSLEKIPVLVRAGSIVPMENGRVLELHVYPPATGGRVTFHELYQDAGDGYGDFRLDRFSLSRKGGQLLIENTHQGSYLPQYEAIALQVHGLAVTRAMVDGNDTPVKDNHIDLSEMPKTIQMEV